MKVTETVDMRDASVVCSAVRAYLDQKAPVLFFILSPEGQILSANRYASQLTGNDLLGKSFYEVVVDFSGKFDLFRAVGDPSSERMLTIDTAQDSPETFFFTFEQIQDRVLAFGRMDTDELESMRKSVLSLNREQGSLMRELHKTNAQLEEKKKALNQSLADLNQTNQTLNHTVSELQEALGQVKQLSGLLPICSYCKQIRDDKGYWNQIEDYISSHSEAEFSHGICQNCLQKHFPDMDFNDD